MNIENKKKIWSEILKAGEYLRDKLPSNPRHPKGRNPYAHVSLEIINKFKMSYKDIPDNKFNLVLDYIKYIKNNPS